MNILSTYPWALFLVSLFGVVFFVQFLYHVSLFFRFSFKKTQKSLPQELPQVSIVIVARNKDHYLRQNLPAILQQKYGTYEVIVVNDHSSDETADTLMVMKTRFPHLKFVSLDSVVTNIKGSRFPLSLGIRSASYEHILVTEPSCYPASEEWLQMMASHFTTKKNIVLGFSTYEKKGNFLSAMRRYDIVHYAVQYFAYALAKKPYTGSGKNMAYSKNLFFHSNAFNAHSTLAYGANELFANKVVKKNNTALEFAPEAHIIARPVAEHKMWRRRKLIRNRMQRRYRPSQKLLLAIYHISIPALYVTFAVALAAAWQHQILLLVLLSIMLMKQIIQYVTFGKALKKLNEKKLIPFIFFFDILLACINPWFYIRSLFGKVAVV